MVIDQEPYLFGPFSFQTIKYYSCHRHNELHALISMSSLAELCSLGCLAASYPRIREDGREERESLIRDRKAKIIADYFWCSTPRIIKPELDKPQERSDPRGKHMPPQKTRGLHVRIDKKRVFLAATTTHLFGEIEAQPCGSDEV